MATFVHLTDEATAKRLVRSGIAARSRYVDRRGVYAMPVTRNFYVSHQWLRELKRHGQRTLCGVYFRVPDEELVIVGRYNREHQEMTATRAAALVGSASSEGVEVFIPRRVDAKDITRVRHLPQVLGWRFSPEAKGRPPCACWFCSKGDYGARRLRGRLGES
jgi:hypothetical protein